MIHSSSSIVMLGSNRIGVGTTSRSWCGYRLLISMRAWFGASVSKMTFLSIGVAPLISMRWVLGSLHPLSTLISSSRGLEVVGVLDHLPLRGRKSLSSWLRSLLKLQLNRAAHRSY
jgi:hypothetical protein